MPRTALAFALAIALAGCDASPLHTSPDLAAGPTADLHSYEILVRVVDGSGQAQVRTVRFYDNASGSVQSFQSSSSLGLPHTNPGGANLGLDIEDGNSPSGHVVSEGTPYIITVTGQNPDHAGVYLFAGEDDPATSGDGDTYLTYRTDTQTWSVNRRASNDAVVAEPVSLTAPSSTLPNDVDAGTASTSYLSLRWEIATLVSYDFAVASSFAVGPSGLQPKLKYADGSLGNVPNLTSAVMTPSSEPLHSGRINWTPPNSTASGLRFRVHHDATGRRTLTSTFDVVDPNQGGGGVPCKGALCP